MTIFRASLARSVWHAKMMSCEKEKKHLKSVLDRDTISLINRDTEIWCTKGFILVLPFIFRGLDLIFQTRSQEITLNTVQLLTSWCNYCRIPLKRFTVGGGTNKNRATGRFELITRIDVTTYSTVCNVDQGLNSVVECCLVKENVLWIYEMTLTATIPVQRYFPLIICNMKE